ncbi:MAG: ABC transporter permease, partial [bacterium]
MKKRSANIRAKLLPVGAFCLILLIWWGLSASGMIPGYMLPSPADVVGAFIHDFPNLMHHAFVSVTEALLGLLIGMALAFGLACVMERFLTLEQAVMPLLVATQT